MATITIQLNVKDENFTATLQKVTRFLKGFTGTQVAINAPVQTTQTVNKPTTVVQEVEIEDEE